jgi:hypothetical protein
LLCLSQVNDDCRPPDLLKPTQAEVQGQLEATFQEAAWRSRRDVTRKGWRVHPCFRSDAVPRAHPIQSQQEKT